MMHPEQERLDYEPSDISELCSILERAYSARLPAHHDEAIRRALAARRALSRRRARSRFPALLLAAALLVAGGVAFAASEIINLGKPTDFQSTDSYFPLSGFHRIGSTRRVGGQPVLLFIGVKGVDPPSSVERWPVVKALEQFGTLDGVRAVDPSCFMYKSVSGPTPVCSAATFDLSHAGYRSHYLHFISLDVASFDGRRITPVQRLSGWEGALWRRYACASSRLPCPSPARQAAEPLLAIGNYLQTNSQIMLYSDFAKPWPGRGTLINQQPLSFDTIRQALVSGKNPPYGNHLVESVNAEANIITGLICHADGMKPASVCRRPVIVKLLKHVQ